MLKVTSMAESDLHKTIKYRAVDYLYNKGFHISRTEVRDHYYGIIDAWGIRPRDLYTTGIEVKVSRSDWLAAKHKDRKTEEVAKHMYNGWTSTNEIYYACPSGLIFPDEVSPSVGLLWWNGNRFVNKKKPRFVQVHLKDKVQTVLGIYEPWITRGAPIVVDSSGNLAEKETAIKSTLSISPFLPIP